MRPLVRTMLWLLLASAGSAAAAEVSLFNGLPHEVDVVRRYADGGAHRPWAAPMRPGSRWRLRLPAGARLEFQREGRILATLDVGEQARQGHVVRLPGVAGPVPPPPPAGQPSEFPNWRRSTSVRPHPPTSGSKAPDPPSSNGWSFPRR